MVETVTTEVRSYGNAAKIAKLVGEMRSAGSSHNAIATALRIDSETVDAALAHVAAGTTCNLPLRDYSHRRDLPSSKVDRIAADVIRMIDEEQLSGAEAAKQLGVSRKMVSRAYKQANGAKALAMAKEGKAMSLPMPLRLPKAMHDRIRELLLAGGLSYRTIAREVGCDHHAVSDAHKRMKAQDAA